MSSWERNKRKQWKSKNHPPTHTHTFELATRPLPLSSFPCKSSNSATLLQNTGKLRKILAAHRRHQDHHQNPPEAPSWSVQRAGEVVPGPSPTQDRWILIQVLVTPAVTPCTDHSYILLTSVSHLCCVFQTSTWEAMLSQVVEEEASFCTSCANIENECPGHQVVGAYPPTWAFTICSSGSTTNMLITSYQLF